MQKRYAGTHTLKVDLGAEGDKSLFKTPNLQRREDCKQWVQEGDVIRLYPQIKTILKALTLPLSSLNLEQTGKSVLLQDLVLKTTVSLSLPELLADGSDIDARVKLDVYFAFKTVKKKERKKTGKVRR